MKKSLPPHELDASMDLLNVAKLESARDIVLRKHPRGITTTLPLSWKEMGVEIPLTKKARRRLA